MAPHNYAGRFCEPRASYLYTNAKGSILLWQPSRRMIWNTETAWIMLVSRAPTLTMTYVPLRGVRHV